MTKPNRTLAVLVTLGLCVSLASCTPSSSSSGACELTEDTTSTDRVNEAGCHVLERDTSACKAEREAAGLSGHWLRFSCRVSLSVSGGAVVAESDGLPDHVSNYFPAGDPCHEEYTGATQNPNEIAEQNLVVNFPLAPTTTSEPMRTAVVGLALNGVAIFGNFAAPGDDIFQEAQTFDRCGAHPQMSGMYHYHSEPYALSFDDDAFIGVMRDGYPIYGRKDADGSLPTLDPYGGHEGTTPDSPDVPVYHYHVNEQTSSGGQTAGQKQWFITKGSFRGTPGSCSSCK